MIGVVFGLQDEFHAEVVEQLYLAVDGTGYELVLGAVAPTRAGAPGRQSLLDYRCEALILVGPALPGSELEELASTMPVVIRPGAALARRGTGSGPMTSLARRLAVEYLAASDTGRSRTSTASGHRAPPNAVVATGRRCAPAASRPISGSCAVG